MNSLSKFGLITMLAVFASAMIFIAVLVGAK